MVLSHQQESGHAGLIEGLTDAGVTFR